MGVTKEEQAKIVGEIAKKDAEHHLAKALSDLKECAGWARKAREHDIAEQLFLNIERLEKIRAGGFKK